MSFGLLTATDVDHVPQILRRCAHGYRGSVSTINQHVWYLIADEFDKFAAELNDKIQYSKRHPPKQARVLLEE